MALALSRHSSEVAAAVRHVVAMDSAKVAHVLRSRSLIGTDVGHDIILATKKDPDRWQGLLTYLPELAEVYGR